MKTGELAEICLTNFKLDICLSSYIRCFSKNVQGVPNLVFFHFKLSKLSTYSTADVENLRVSDPYPDPDPH